MKANTIFPKAVYLSDLLHKQSAPEVSDGPSVEVLSLSDEAPEWLDVPSEGFDLEGPLGNEGDRDYRLGYI